MSFLSHFHQHVSILRRLTILSGVFGATFFFTLVMLNSLAGVETATAQEIPPPPPLPPLPDFVAPEPPPAPPSLLPIDPSGYCDAVTQIPLNECEALVALYQNTDGPNWITRTNWLENNSPCDWFGITCAAGHVIEIRLRTVTGRICDNWDENQFGNGLVGNIPPELGYLTNLEILDLNNNKLGGELPTQLGHLTNLRKLCLRYGNFKDEARPSWMIGALTGSIPAELGNLINLDELDLGRNQLNEEMPPELNNLINLETLELDANELNGPIPESIGNLSSLVSLNLSRNKLTTVPSHIGYLSNTLVSLNLKLNEITNLPPHLGYLENLKYLYWHGNSVIGEIPPHLGYLTNLYELTLASPEISGRVPLQLALLTKLHALTIAGNNLEGEMPDLGSLQQLTSLHIHNTDLSGDFPLWIGDLISLTTLSMYSNQFTGPIPDSWGELSNLNWLSLGAHTEEVIPEWVFSGHPELDYLLLTGPFTGTINIPDTVFPTLTQLEIKGTNLTGGLSELCKLTTLELLDIRENEQLLDEIPNCYAPSASEDTPYLGNLEALLFILNHSLTGTIPSEISLLPNLKNFYLQNSNVGGQIPTELGDLVQIESLILNNNQLEGEIPPELGNLVSLTNLYLQSNKLSGPIPSQFSNLANIRSLQLQNNNLVSEIPPEFANIGSNSINDPTIASGDFIGLDRNGLWLDESNVALSDFLEEHAVDWVDTQTVPPTNLQASNVTTNTVELSWTPITYTDDGGFYQVTAVSNFENMTPTLTTTNDKSADSIDIELVPGSTYTLTAQTFTPAHVNAGVTQLNDIWSTPSEPVVVTLPHTTLHLVVLALDNKPGDPGSLNEQYYPTIDALRAATDGDPSKIIVVLSDQNGEDPLNNLSDLEDTQIHVIQNGKFLSLPNGEQGLPDPANCEAPTLNPEIREYNTANGQAIGCFIRWARDNYAAPQTLFTFIGHGMAVAPDADAFFKDDEESETLFDELEPSDVFFPAPIHKDVHPGETDYQSHEFISPYDLAIAMQIGTRDGLEPIDVVDLTHCFAATVEEFYEVAYGNYAREDRETAFAKMLIGSPNYAYFGPPLLEASVRGTHYSQNAQALATGIVDAYAEAFQEDSADHPRVIVVVDAAKLLPIKEAVTDLSGILVSRLNSDQATRTGTKNLISDAYETSQQYDTTYCQPQDWALESPDAISDLYDFASRLVDSIYAVNEISSQAVDVMQAVEDAVVVKESANGTPWFADTAPEWIFSDQPGTGLGIYTDFKGELGEADDITLNLISYWYTDIIRDDNPHPYAFLSHDVQSGNKHWGDVHLAFWQDALDGGQIRGVDEICLPVLTPVQRPYPPGGDLSAERIAFPDPDVEVSNLHVNESTPVAAVIKTTHNIPGMLINFQVIAPNNTIPFSHTIQTGYLVPGDYLFNAPEMWQSFSTGEHILKVTIDPDDRYTGENENTNIISHTYTVLPETTIHRPIISATVSGEAQIISDNLVTLGITQSAETLTHAVDALIVYWYQYMPGETPNTQVATQVAGPISIPNNWGTPPDGHFTVDVPLPSAINRGPVVLHVWGLHGRNYSPYPAIVKFNYIPTNIDLDAEEDHYYLFVFPPGQTIVNHLSTSNNEEANLFVWEPRSIWEPDYMMTGNEVQEIALQWPGEFVFNVRGVTDTVYNLSVTLMNRGIEIIFSSQKVESVSDNSPIALPMRPTFIPPIPIQLPDELLFKQFMPFVAR